jgi:hypothetical protein
VLTTAVVGLFLLFDWWPSLRGDFGWRWPYARPQLSSLPRLLPGLLLLIIYGIGVRFLTRRRAWLHVGWCLLGAAIIPVAFLYWSGNPLELLYRRTISAGVTGGFRLATEIEVLDETLSSWLELMPSFQDISSHFTTSPPAWPTLYHLVGKAFALNPDLSEPLAMPLRSMQCDNIPLMTLSNAQLASAWIGIASPLWAALTIIPLYALGRRVATEKIARRAISWWPLVPSLTLFLGTLNTPYPLAATTIVWLLWAGLTEVSRPRSFLWLILSGSLAAFAILFSFAFIPILLLCGILTLLVWQRKEGSVQRGSLKWPVMVGLQLGLGLAVVWLAYGFITEHTIFDVFSVGMTNHLQLDRPYWPWLLLHSWDFAIFVGIPVFGLALLGIVGRWGRGVRQLNIALMVTLLILVISGTGRGETGRIWLLVMPLTLLATAAVLQGLPRRQRQWLVVSQVAWFLVILMALRPVSTEFSAPLTYDQIAPPVINTATVPVNGRFGDELDLSGYQVRYESATKDLWVHFDWRARKQMSIPYFFSAVLISPEGEVMQGTHWQPLEVRYPTTCWHLADAPIIDRIRLPVDPPVVEGAWWLSLSVFELTGQNDLVRLPYTSADGQSDDQVGLGPMWVGG